MIVFCTRLLRFADLRERAADRIQLLLGTIPGFKDASFAREIKENVSFSIFKLIKGNYVDFSPSQLVVTSS